MYRHFTFVSSWNYIDTKLCLSDFMSDVLADVFFVEDEPLADLAILTTSMAEGSKMNL